MLSKTEAVVLKSMRYRDTSKIVTFYTNEFGKIRGIAKGARTNKSKFGAALEPLSHVSIILYKKEHRDLHLLSQSDILNPHKGILLSLERLRAGLSIIELVNQVTPGEERNGQLFSLLKEMLDAVEAEEKEPLKYFFAFALRLSALFGFRPNLGSCRSCGRALSGFRTDERVAFQIARGAVICPLCLRASNSGRTDDFVQPVPAELWESASMDVGKLRHLEDLLEKPLGDIRTLRLPESVSASIDETLRSYLRYHFDAVRPIRSAALAL